MCGAGAGCLAIKDSKEVGRKVLFVHHIEQLLYAGTDPESDITEYSLVFEDEKKISYATTYNLWTWFEPESLHVDFNITHRYRSVW